MYVGKTRQSEAAVVARGALGVCGQATPPFDEATRMRRIADCSLEPQDPSREASTKK